MILRDDEEGAQVSWTHFSVEGFLDGCVVNEDEIAEGEIECLNCRLVVVLEQDGGLDSGSDDGGAKTSEVGAMLLECDRAASDEVGS